MHLPTQGLSQLADTLRRKVGVGAKIGGPVGVRVSSVDKSWVRVELW